MYQLSRCHVVYPPGRKHSEHESTTACWSILTTTARIRVPSTERFIVSAIRPRLLMNVTLHYYTAALFLFLALSLSSHLSDLHGRYKLRSIVGFPSQVSGFPLVCNDHIPSYLLHTPTKTKEQQRRRRQDTQQQQGYVRTRYESTPGGRSSSPLLRIWPPRDSCIMRL